MAFGKSQSTSIIYQDSIDCVSGLALAERAAEYECELVLLDKTGNTLTSAAFTIRFSN